MSSTCSGKNIMKNYQRITFGLPYPNSSIEYFSRNRHDKHLKRTLVPAPSKSNELLKCGSFASSPLKISFVQPFSIRLTNLTSGLTKHSIEHRRHYDTDSIQGNHKSSTKLKQSLVLSQKSNKPKHQPFRTGKVCFNYWLQTLLIILLCALQLTSVSGGRYRRLKHSRLDITSRRMMPKYLTHPFVVEAGRNRLNKMCKFYRLSSY